MSEDRVLLVIVGVLAVVNLIAFLAVRATLNQVMTEILRYRPWGAQPGGSDAQRAPGSPLQEIFRHYSTLTERMAELVFRLTDPKQSNRPSIAAELRELTAQSAPPSSSMLVAAVQELARDDADTSKG